MCVDYDLFGEVIILKSDVDYWLNDVLQITEPSRKKRYAETHPLASIIKREKLSGRFYVAKMQHDKNLIGYANNQSGLFLTKYKETPPHHLQPCPAHFHICDNKECAIFKARAAREYSRKMAKRRKQSRNKLFK